VGIDPTTEQRTGNLFTVYVASPAQRRQELEQGHCQERENLVSDGKGEGEEEFRAESTDAGIRDGCPCSSEDPVVMAGERRWAEHRTVH